MRYYHLLIVCMVLFISCGEPESTVTLKSGYNFSGIRAIAVENIHDYLNAQGSGTIVKDALERQLKGLGFKIVVKQMAHDAIVVCSITEYNERRTQPYTIMVEDKGSGQLSNQSAYEAADNAAGTGSSGKSSIYNGTMTRAKEITYTDAYVGVKLRLVDANNNTTVWSSDFAYSSLDKKTALTNSIKGALRPLKKILRK